MKHFTMFLALVLFAAFSVGCESEIDKKPAAKVNDPAKKDPKAAPGSAPAKKDPKAAAKGKTLKLDKANSRIGFIGAKATGDHKGEFKTISGEATVADGKPSMLKFTVETASLTAEAGPMSDKLTGHLKNADFLDVEKFKTASFSSTSIKEKKDGANTHEISGDLTIKGIKKNISFPAKVTKNGDKWVGEASFKIKRFDWKIEYKGKADDLIKDEVALDVKMVFPGA